MEDLEAQYIQTENWYTLENEAEIASPGLIFYESRIKENIGLLCSMIDHKERLRPHVKTHKTAEITKLMLEAGIIKYKCATIAEAEMLAVAGAVDILLAYQPVGPNIERLLTLKQQFPEVLFSCLIDNLESGVEISKSFLAKGEVIDVYLDLNVGMNRTGILPSKALALYASLNTLEGLHLVGLHAYDGHIHESDYASREAQALEIIQILEDLSRSIEAQYNRKPVLIAGGTPTIPIYSQEENLICSAGTFVLWDGGYQDAFKEQAFLPAALLISRIVSLPTDNLICTDLGHKAVAAENPLNKRVVFLNAPELVTVSQSEEHLVLDAGPNHHYRVGDVLYGLPYHICPTVALYEQANVIAADGSLKTWAIASRKRKITI
jgi:D-serine deaminase-like pyridoxal phosphate-dependent protein